MIELVVYNNNSDIPPLLYQQIVDFLRMEWPEGFQSENKLRNWAVHKKYNPITFILKEKNVLISHVAVVWKYIQHEGETYKIYALSGMLTYPQFRNSGYAMQLVQAAKEYILKQDGDMIMIHSTLKGFYEKAGFEPMPTLTTLIGHFDNPSKSEENLFLYCITEKAKTGKKNFENKSFYFGEDMW